jgi:AcrR family transcriptional regulator
MHMKTNRQPAPTHKRPYRQSERAQAAARTAEAILDAFTEFFATRWFDEITLAMIAEKAEVTVPTILRHFGSKQGLVQALQEREIRVRREVATGDIAAAVGFLIDDYETLGDLVMRQLAQEDRVPEIRRMTDYGRAVHREWITKVFAPWLDPLPDDRREWRIDQIVAVLDVYVWKLLRRDRGRSPAEVAQFMESALHAVLGMEPRQGEPA